MHCYLPFTTERFVIDFTFHDSIEASKYKDLFKLIEKTVIHDREIRSKEQEELNRKVLAINPLAKVNKHHINFYNKWWQLSYGREDMLEGHLPFTITKL